MTDSSIREELLAFNDLERRAKEIFQRPRGGAVDPRALLREVLPELRSSPLPEDNSPGRRIPESFFVRGGADVGVVKHIRYLPVVPHAHEFVEMSFVYEGSCDHEVDAQAFRMTRGDVALVPPGTVHAIGVVDDDTVVVNVLVRRSTFDRAFFELLLDDDLLADFFNRTIYGLAPSHPAILFRTGDDAAVRQLVEGVYAEAAADRRYRTRTLNSLVSLLCTTLMRDHGDTVTLLGPAVAAADRAVYEVLRDIQRGYTSVSLADLAARYGYSEASLSRAIKRAAGRPFTQIVRELRLLRAGELIRSTAMPIDQAATSAGYSDVSHFYRAFKQFYGMTPRDYRSNVARAVPGA